MRDCGTARTRLRREQERTPTHIFGDQGGSPTVLSGSGRCTVRKICNLRSTSNVCTLLWRTQQVSRYSYSKSMGCKTSKEADDHVGELKVGNTRRRSRADKPDLALVSDLGNGGPIDQKSRALTSSARTPALTPQAEAGYHSKGAPEGTESSCPAVAVTPVTPAAAGGEGGAGVGEGIRRSSHDQQKQQQHQQHQIQRQSRFPSTKWGSPSTTATEVSSETRRGEASKGGIPRRRESENKNEKRRERRTADARLGETAGNYSKQRSIILVRVAVFGQVNQ